MKHYSSCRWVYGVKYTTMISKEHKEVIQHNFSLGPHCPTRYQFLSIDAYSHIHFNPIYSVALDFTTKATKAFILLNSNKLTQI